MSQFNKPWRWGELTSRQKQVALMAVEGKLNRFGMSQEIGVSKHTVRYHLAEVYKILGIQYGRVQLAFEVGRHWKEMKP
jgi:DNA-binding NarL/FixJ family response regulator